VSAHGLQRSDVVAVARNGNPVTLGADALEAMQRTAAVVEGFVHGDVPVYGVTTGFGSLASVVISARTQQAWARRSSVRSCAD